MELVRASFGRCVINVSSRHPPDTYLRQNTANLQNLLRTLLRGLYGETLSNTEKVRSQNRYERIDGTAPAKGRQAARYPIWRTQHIVVDRLDCLRATGNGAFQAGCIRGAGSKCPNFH